MNARAAIFYEYIFKEIYTEKVEFVAGKYVNIPGTKKYLIEGFVGSHKNKYSVKPSINLNVTTALNGLGGDNAMRLQIKHMYRPDLQRFATTSSLHEHRLTVVVSVFRNSHCQETKKFTGLINSCMHLPSQDSAESYDIDIECLRNIGLNSESVNYSTPANQDNFGSVFRHVINSLKASGYNVDNKQAATIQSSLSLLPTTKDYTNMSLPNQIDQLNKEFLLDHKINQVRSGKQETHLISIVNEDVKFPPNMTGLGILGRVEHVIYGRNQITLMPVNNNNKLDCTPYQMSANIEGKITISAGDIVSFNFNHDGGNKGVGQPNASDRFYILSSVLSFSTGEAFGENCELAINMGHYDSLVT